MRAEHSVPQVHETTRTVKNDRETAKKQAQPRNEAEYPETAKGKARPADALLLLQLLDPAKDRHRHPKDHEGGDKCAKAHKNPAGMADSAKGSSRN
ncbi:MAG: hypothetical protein CMJ64_22550 [Planctomycetaceae bacterium]|nr:hypothetical protein [Planctomycetaceae bacterium]